jgi:hypothetical protein
MSTSLFGSLPHIVANAPPSLVDFLVYNVLFYQCISDVLIVMFIRDMCSCAFICLVLLVDGVHPIPAFKKIKNKLNFLKYICIYRVFLFLVVKIVISLHI